MQVVLKIAALWVAYSGLLRSSVALKSPKPDTAIQATAIKQEMGTTLLDALLGSSDSKAGLVNDVIGAWNLIAGMVGEIDAFQQPWTKLLEYVRQLRMPMPVGLSQLCDQHVRLFFNDLLNSFILLKNPMQQWSVQMLDSMVKPPAGMLKGTIIIWPGSSNECVDVVVSNNGSAGAAGARPGDPDVAFVGEHCLAQIKVKTAGFTHVFQAAAEAIHAQAFYFKFAICFPSTCNHIDKNKLMRFAHPSIEVNEAMCHKRDVPPMDILAISTSFLLIIPIVIVTFGTLLDLWTRHTKEDFGKATKKATIRFLLNISVFRTLERLGTPPQPPDDVFNFIQGIRFLSVAWVIYGHTYSTVLHLDLPWRELMDMLRFSKNWFLAPLLASARLAVETFFFIGGFCAVYFFLQGKKVTTLTVAGVLAMHVKRYLRLTPSFAYVVAFVIGPWRYMWTGPFWSHVQNVREDCKELWWSDLLYITNFLKATPVGHQNNCQEQFWYLMVDMQIYLIVPPLLLLTVRKPRWGFATMRILYVASMTALGVIYVRENIHYLISVQMDHIASFGKSMEGFIIAYRNPFIRAAPYIMGMGLGYYMNRVKKTGIHMKSPTVLIGWLSCMSITSLMVYIHIPFINGSTEVPSALNLIYGLMSGSLWCLAIGWIVFACANGYGGLVTRFLSCYPMAVLGRLTYCIFLTHLMVKDTILSAGQTLIPVDALSMLIYAISATCFTVPIAIVLHVLVEAPVEILIYAPNLKILQAIIDGKNLNEKNLSGIRYGSTRPLKISMDLNNTIGEKFTDESMQFTSKKL